MSIAKNLLGIVRGMGIGVLAHLASVLLMGAAFMLLRPFVWAALYGMPYVATQGPNADDTGEWLILQLISALVIPPKNQRAEK